MFHEVKILGDNARQDQLCGIMSLWIFLLELLLA